MRAVDGLVATRGPAGAALHEGSVIAAANQELACDARVMRRFPETRWRYAGAMLKSQLGDAGSLDGTGASGWGWRIDHPLKERIQMLHHAQRNYYTRCRGRLFAGILVAATAAGAVLVAAP